MTTLSTDRGSIELRRLTMDDLDAYRDLRLDGLQRHPVAFGSDYADEVDQPLEHWRERVERYVGSSSSCLMVAAAGAELIGMAGIYRMSGRKLAHNATLVSVYLRPAWRGLGLMDRLIASCLDWAQDVGVVMVRLNVATTNTAAIRCYVRAGFAVHGLEPAVIYHADQYHDELLMFRRLA